MMCLHFYSTLFHESEFLCNLGIRLLCHISQQGWSKRCSHFLSAVVKEGYQKMKPLGKHKKSFWISQSHDRMFHYLISNRYHIWETKLREGKGNLICGNSGNCHWCDKSITIGLSCVCVREEWFLEGLPCRMLRGLELVLYLAQLSACGLHWQCEIHWMHSLSENKYVYCAIRGALCLMLAFHSDSVWQSLLDT